LKNGVRRRRTAAPIPNRSATPANGGMPLSPTRIAAQVVPQMRTRRARLA